MSPAPAIRPGSHPPLVPHDYTGTCWWCGNPADSREHRHKASDLRREFDPLEYGAGDVIIRRAGAEEAIPVRGPNAKVAKWRDQFCARCNNERSQPLDQAYDKFIEWFLAHESEVESTGNIRLDEIFHDHVAGSVNVLRYFAKHIGCRIADAGLTVPPTLIDFLDRGEEPSGMVFSFEINGTLVGISAIMKMKPMDGTGFLGFGPVTTEQSRDGSRVDVVRGWWSYHGLQMIWEWKTEYAESWTNLLGPVAELPLVDREEGEALKRTAAQRARDLTE